MYATGSNKKSRQWQYTKSTADLVERAILTALNIQELGLNAGEVRVHIAGILHDAPYDYVHIYSSDVFIVWFVVQEPISSFSRHTSTPGCSVINKETLSGDKGASAIAR